jgi:hypothetical protein
LFVDEDLSPFDGALKPRSEFGDFPGTHLARSALNEFIAKGFEPRAKRQDTFDGICIADL